MFIKGGFYTVEIKDNFMMQAKPLHTVNDDELQSYVQKVVFLRQIAQSSEQQFNFLVKQTQVLTLQPEQCLFKQGSKDACFYAVIQGRLSVFVEGQEQPVGQVLAGQLVSALSVVSNQPRTASVCASGRSETILLAINFAVFGRLDDFSQLSLMSKLYFYRSVANYTFWKLEQYQHHFSDKALASELQELENFKGELNSVTELHFLDAKIRRLKSLLMAWNEQT